jgi:hypothetical protein
MNGAALPTAITRRSLPDDRLLAGEPALAVIGILLAEGVGIVGIDPPVAAFGAQLGLFGIVEQLLSPVGLAFQFDVERMLEHLAT